MLKSLILFHHPLFQFTFRTDRFKISNNNDNSIVHLNSYVKVKKRFHCGVRVYSVNSQ